MNVRKKLKLGKIEILVCSVLALLLLFPVVPNVTETQENIKTNDKASDLHTLQKLVDKFYYKHTEFPSKYQPTIGFPTEINVHSLGLNKFPNYNESNYYLVDAYGSVFILKDGFLPPESVEIVKNQKNEVYIRWKDNGVSEGYGIREVKNGDVKLLEKAFGKMTASIVNLSYKGKPIVEKRVGDFESVSGDYKQYNLSNYQSGSIYAVYGIHSEYGTTPEVTIGYKNIKK